MAGKPAQDLVNKAPCDRHSDVKGIPEILTSLHTPIEPIGGSNHRIIAVFYSRGACPNSLGRLNDAATLNETYPRSKVLLTMVLEVGAATPSGAKRSASAARPRVGTRKM
jgi:hypothetical protein